MQNPHLSITKVATEASYDAVGDVIHYTIVATNDGNVTLAQRDGDRSERERPESVRRRTGRDLAPGASMTCTATHTVTQADLDAGHYANTACVDDGAGGAAQECDDVEDVPAARTRIWRSRRSATEASYDAVGDVIHYTIVATNDGNVTLAQRDGDRSERERA